MADQTWVLAIDFGTSYTVAASRIGDRSPEVIELGGERRIPSVVLVTDEGETHIGTAAINMGRSHPGRTVRRPKSRLGQPAPVVLGGRAHQVGDLVASLLRVVYDEAIRHHGSTPSEVRLTHPATWNSPRREQLRLAATTAGIADPVLVPEPVAAAISFMGDIDVAVGERVLVYDLGGGTFDTAALEATDEGFVVIGRPGGDATIGGELFDELVARAIGEQLDPATYELLEVAGDRDWADANSALRAEARNAKEALSSQPYVDVVVPLPTGIERASLDTAALEAIIRPHLEASAEVLHETAAGAGLDTDSITAIHLVGGASRTPLVEKIVRSEFPGVTISRRGDPKSAVALGATHPMATPTSLAQNSDAARAPTIDQPGPPPGPATGGVDVAEGVAAAAATSLTSAASADETPPRQPRPDATPAAATAHGSKPSSDLSPEPVVAPSVPDASPPSAPPPPTPDSSAAVTVPAAQVTAPEDRAGQAAAPGGLQPGEERGRRGPVLMVVLLVVLVVGALVVVVLATGGDDEKAVPTSVRPPTTADDSNGPNTSLTESGGSSSGTEAADALLTSDDLLIRDGPTGWSTEVYPNGEPVGLASLDVNNEFCGAPQPDGAEDLVSVYFDRINDSENLSAIAHQVVVFDNSTSASNWVEGVFNALDTCVRNGANGSLLTLADGTDYVPDLSTVGVSPEFEEDGCFGRLTNTVYRAFVPGDADPSTSDPVFVQIHRIRQCGKSVSVLTSRTTTEASQAEDIFLGVLEGRAFDLVNALPAS